MDLTEMSQCLKIYDNVVGSSIGQFVEKSFKNAPPNSKFATLFNGCREALKRGDFKSSQQWLDALTISFNDCIRAIGENTELGCSLATLLQQIDDQIKSRRLLSNKMIMDMITKASDKLHEMMPHFPDNLRDFQELMKADHLEQIRPILDIPKLEAPQLTQDDLDLTVSRLRSLDSDRHVTNVMDILQRYEIYICQDSEDDITVDLDYIDPLTTKKIQDFLDNNV
ncbi:hypothetical protein TVAG_040440 [Trichomonas vaginalis G3]|uniref:NET domain-containing protein n=1 Tax=Trichomonas vaginalis (strain ATCC PRA-98 / G3) TaxID=412133 RepID=A2F1T9_TRIV3|nr:hypothetical protein TVAGG3_0038020 [Trichomonas vaginalis G3]EAY01139.1 hypothetical protein TVAG_040440 [Trichomonas vaginalis G3]KAI5540522.1 hypothetical protein TVAGG3_0038020 [Trichomonas vaginalis G3]|eukprot:XP_001313991.1 hypothetical protein [Trichomonas vaginalis G3]